MLPRVIAATLLLLLTVGLAACGSGDPETTGAGGQEASTTAEPETDGADVTDVDVITGWIGALSDGDVEAAAEYFALPSTAENGILIQIRTAKDAVAFNESLPCGGELIKAESTGDFTTATFELTERPGGGCDTGTGGTASTSFVIEDGKITDWRRVPGSGDVVPPGSTGGETV